MAKGDRLNGILTNKGDRLNGKKNKTTEWMVV